MTETCPFCEKPTTNLEHVGRCSIVDAKKKLATNGVANASISCIVAIITFAKSYDTATDEERQTMWICTQCLCFGVSPIFSTTCPVCKHNTRMRAKDYVEDEDSEQQKTA